MPTKIEWVTNQDGTKGKTWNPITGCTQISPGCAHCYAKRMAKRLAGRCGYPAAPHEFDVTLHPDRLEEPLRWRKPRTCFVCSMSDLFHEDVPFEFIWQIYNVMHTAKQHVFQLLTKRPERALEFYQWLSDQHCETITANWFPNIWFGITAENQKQADKRIPVLLQIPAAVRFVSIEPMLGPIDFNRVPGAWAIQQKAGANINWVIVGGETGPGARPMHPDWVRSVRDQCIESGVSFFFKSWGDWRHNIPQFIRSLPPDHGFTEEFSRVGKKVAGRFLDGREWNEYPEVER